MNAPVLSIDQLSVIYRSRDGEVLALDEVTAQVGRGEIVGLVGQTGCGKTTLVNAILGSLPRHQPGIVKGRIRVAGKVLRPGGARDRQAGDRHVTLVPQNTFESLNPLFRIRTHIVDLMRSSPHAKKGWRGWIGGERFRDRILNALEAVQLPDARKIIERYPHQLSGGQRQRIMIAMALLSDPQLIVADEPTASLDVTTQMEVLKLFRRIARDEGISILMTTHNLAAAWEICDKIAVMYGGRVIESADRRSFFAKPAHPYTRSLLAAASNPLGINARVGIHGEVTKGFGGCAFSETCTQAQNVCSESKPQLRLHQTNHMVACHNPSDAISLLPKIDRAPA
ncbi:ABC transporter ATP-binding protein [Rhizobium brockwellii]|uniref:ABC transporter ATP-binding protein n=1 Tax=Rhizobium brockwellii TaxID=3019932 RepID=UPI003F97BA4D